MIESLRARWFIIGVVFVAAFIYLVPNFVDVGEKWIFSKNKMIYGLDIQGGLHLVMGVDVDAVIVEKTERLAKNLQAEAADRKLTFLSLVVDPENKKQVKVRFNAPVEAVGFKSFIGESYGATLQVIPVGDNEVDLKYYDGVIQEYKKQVVDQAIEVIRNRIDEFGVSEPAISAQGDKRILVQLPGIKDSMRAKELINKTARLDFRKVSDKLKPEELQALIDTVEKEADFSLGKNDLKYTQYVRLLNEKLKGKIPENTMVAFEKLDNAVSLEAGRRPFLLDTDSDLSGAQLEDASVRPDQYGKPEVIFSFDVEGRRRFAALTEKAAGGLIAIVLDDVVKSAPSVERKIDSDSARITLGSGRSYEETRAEANLIATALRAGALPAALEQLEERTVGPTVGADSIEKGKIAGLVGTLLVFVFMIVYYRSLGVIADLGLVLNLTLTLALLTSLGATLTLPGIAGLVLTVGMAVDANILIFERMKEEVAKGVGLKTAVRDGFNQAYSAIFDSNITTIATCVALYYYGTGPIRGFAVTLTIGIATSMFTAVFVSKTLMVSLVERYNFRPLASATKGGV